MTRAGALLDFHGSTGWKTSVRTQHPEAHRRAAREAGGARLALEMLEREPVDLLLVDFAMPTMTGLDVAQQVRERHPSIKVILVTGYGDIAHQPDLPVLRKPFRLGDLAATVQTVLGRDSAPPSNVLPLRKA